MQNCRDFHCTFSRLFSSTVAALQLFLYSNDSAALKSPSYIGSGCSEILMAVGSGVQQSHSGLLQNHKCSKKGGMYESRFILEDGRREAWTRPKPT